MKLRQNVLVIGGSGFLGSHIVDILSDSGYNVTIFDIKKATYLKKENQMVLGTVLDPEIVDQVVSHQDCVIHLAGIADIDEASEKPIDTVRINILGTVNVLLAACKYNVKNFIYSSTIYVYSERGGFYRCSKQAAENYVEEFGRKYNLPFNIVRYGTLYGTRANKNNSIYRYIHSAITKNQIAFEGSGEEIREFIHVKDAARLTVSLLENCYPYPHITITGHQSMKWQNILCMISEMMNNTVKIDYEDSRNPAHYCYTPYSFTPKMGYKLTSDLSYDMGQGLLEVFAEIFNEVNNHS